MLAFFPYFKNATTVKSLLKVQNIQRSLQCNYESNIRLAISVDTYRENKSVFLITETYSRQLTQGHKTASFGKYLFGGG